LIAAYTEELLVGTDERRPATLGKYVRERQWCIEVEG